MPQALAGKVAVVTGASQGIGRAIAQGLASVGAALHLVGRHRATLDVVAGQIGRDQSVSVDVHAADLTDDDQVRQVAASVSTCDVLIHCAGAYHVGGFGSAAMKDFDELYRTNVRGPYLLTQLLLPALIARRGDVVFMNSTQGLRASAGRSQYAATQHAVKALADSLRDEVNDAGVRVLSVFPGRTATPRMAAIFEAEGRPYRPDALLQPVDVATAVVGALSLADRAELTDLHIRPRARTY